MTDSKRVTREDILLALGKVRTFRAWQDIELVADRVEASEGVDSYAAQDTDDAAMFQRQQIADAIFDALAEPPPSENVDAAVRERVQRFETGRNGEDDTLYRAATDRTYLLGRVDYLMAVLRQPAIRAESGPTDHIPDIATSGDPIENVWLTCSCGWDQSKAAPDGMFVGWAAHL